MIHKIVNTLLLHTTRNVMAMRKWKGEKGRNSVKEAHASFTKE
jgi:hypothetical protein